MDIKKIFGTRIKIIRTSQNLSQERLAELADLDRTYISSIERGQRNVSIEVIHRLSIALNVEITELFK